MGRGYLQQNTYSLIYIARCKLKAIKSFLKLRVRPIRLQLWKRGLTHFVLSCWFWCASTAVGRCWNRDCPWSHFRILLCGPEALSFTWRARAPWRDVVPGCGRVPSTKQSRGWADGGVSGLLGERKTLAGPQGVHPAEHRRLWAAAAGPAALLVHGLGQQCVPRLPVRQQNREKLWPTGSLNAFCGTSYVVLFAGDFLLFRSGRHPRGHNKHGVKKHRLASGNVHYYVIWRFQIVGLAILKDIWHNFIRTCVAHVWWTGQSYSCCWTKHYPLLPPTRSRCAFACCLYLVK